MHKSAAFSDYFKYLLFNREIVKFLVDLYPYLYLKSPTFLIWGKVKVRLFLKSVPK